MYAPAPITSSTAIPRAAIASTQASTRRRVLLAEVDVRLVRLAEAHRRLEPLQEELRAELHHVAILDRPRLALVGVDDHDARAGLLADGSPFSPGREAGAAHPRQPGGFEPREHLVLGQLGRPADLVRLEQEAVRRVGDAADDLVAVEDDRREVAVAEAGHLDRAGAEPLPGAARVADGAGAHTHRVDRHLQEGVERRDLVHVAVPQAHVVGERVGELGRDRPDLAAEATEVVEQAGALPRHRLEHAREAEHVHASSLIRRRLP